MYNLDNNNLHVSESLYRNGTSKLIEILGTLEQQSVNACDFFVTKIFELIQFVSNSKEKKERNYDVKIKSKLGKLEEQIKNINNIPIIKQFSNVKETKMEKEYGKIKNIADKQLQNLIAGKNRIEKEIEFRSDFRKHTFKHQTSEKILKGLALITAPLTLAIMGLGVLLSGASMVTLRVSLQSQKADIVSLAPPNPSPPNLDEKKKLTFYSHNVALSRYNIMNAVNCLASTQDRIKDLTDQIIEQGDDVICLQEAFHEPLVVEHLAKRLQEKGYYILFASKPKWGILSSGLLLASKYPIKNFDFKPYTTGNSKHMNYMANKGVLIANLDLGTDRTISVATTHALCGIPVVGDTQEERDKFAEEKYQEAFNEARHFVNEFAEQNQSNELIFCGDFNAPLLEEKEGLFFEANKTPLTALTEKNQDSGAFNPLIKAELLEEKVYQTNEINHQAVCHASVVEKAALRFHSMASKQALEDNENEILGEEQNVLDHFFRSEKYNTLFDQNNFELTPGNTPRGKNGEPISDHVSLKLTLNLPSE